MDGRRIGAVLHEMVRRWREYPVPMHGTTYLGPIQWLSGGMLSYVTTPDWVEQCPYLGEDEPGAMVFCEARSAMAIRERGAVPHVVADPAAAFWRVVKQVAEGTVQPPTIVDIGAYRALSAVIGSRPFKLFRGELVPGLGGVVIGQGSTLGANTCVDRGIFGEYTELGERVHLDNLVHVGHSVRIEDDVTVAAGCVLGGWSTIRRGCILETDVTVFKGVEIGEGARIGAGSLVTKDVLPGVLAYGRPARTVRDA